MNGKGSDAGSRTSDSMVNPWIDLELHPISDGDYRLEQRKQFDAVGALILSGFFTKEFVDTVVCQSASRETDAFYADSTHNVYLTDTNSEMSDDHPFNRQVVSSKGLIADDQIPVDSPLRDVYGDLGFKEFLCSLLEVKNIYPYDDLLSSINVHFAPNGRELGWHFDNSSFAVTTLLQAPQQGGEFQYVSDVRDADSGEMAFERVAAILNQGEQPSQLSFEAGDLVLFRGRNALHRVTPTRGAVTRILAVFAYNDQPGIGLSTSALQTFYGRTS